MVLIQLPSSNLGRSLLRLQNGPANAVALLRDRGICFDVAAAMEVWMFPAVTDQAADEGDERFFGRPLSVN